MKKIFILTILSLAAFVGCNKQAVMDAPATQEYPSDAIVFSAAGEGISTSVETKATAVTSLTSFNVGCVTGTLGSSETEVFNVVFSGSSNTYTGNQFWPISDAGYKFVGSNVAMTAAATGYTVAASNSTDVLCAVLASPTYKAKNTLVFDHIFARLGDVVVTAAEHYTISDVDIKITPKTGGTYSLFAGNGKTDGTGWSATTVGSATSIANATPGTKSNDIYLVPGTYTLSATWTATRGASVETFSNREQTVSLTAGKINKITTTLGGAASEITFGVEVTPWGNNTLDVNFPM